MQDVFLNLNSETHFGEAEAPWDFVYAHWHENQSKSYKCIALHAQ